MNDLPRTTRALLEALPPRGLARILDVSSWQGTVAAATGGAYVSVDLTACAAATAAGVTAVIHNDMLPDGPFDLIAFDARTYDPGFAAETVAQAAGRLAAGGALLTTARREDVAACFGVVEARGEAWVARAPLPCETNPPQWSYSLDFGGRSLTLASAPGIFSPRSLDEGTRLMLGHIAAAPGRRFLDLGCGAGVVSRVAAELWGCQVTAVDVNARALRLTAMNAPQAEVIASDGFGGLSGREFDVIASNPPYHTDFAVARTFIEGAHRHLTMEGTLYLVVKRADWYVQKVRQVFGGLRVVTAGDYTVIVAQKRERLGGAAPQAAAPGSATTRKHAKRMAAARGRPRK